MRSPRAKGVVIVAREDDQDEGDEEKRGYEHPPDVFDFCEAEPKGPVIGVLGHECEGGDHAL